MTSEGIVAKMLKEQHTMVEEEARAEDDNIPHPKREDNSIQRKKMIPKLQALEDPTIL